MVRPQAGRFISEDPISFAGGDANLYRYAGNSPDNATDPSGMYVESALDAASLAVGYFSLRSSIARGDIFGTVVDAIGVGVDAVALALPLVPGGAGLAIKTARGASAATDVTQNLKRGVQTGQHVLRSIDAGVQVASTALAIRDGDPLGITLGLVGLGIRKGQLAPLDAATESRLYSRIDAGITKTVADGGLKARRASRNRAAAPIDDFAEAHGSSVRRRLVGAREQIGINRETGDLRELEELAHLQKLYPNATILRRKTLFDADRNKIIDSVDSKGRQLDFVVVENNKVLDVVETTGFAVPKSSQIAREDRIRTAGGQFVIGLDNQLIHVPYLSRVSRRA